MSFNNLLIKLKNKKNIPFYVIVFLILTFFIVSICLFKLNHFGKRKSFVFPSADSGKYVVEYRYLTSYDTEKSDGYNLINEYVEELLLGSGLERTKKLFNAKTTVESCFVQKDVLYLNLSGDLLRLESGSLEIKEGVDLLKMNIKKNFPKLKEISLFIDGKSAY